MDFVDYSYFLGGDLHAFDQGFHDFTFLGRRGLAQTGVDPLGKVLQAAQGVVQIALVGLGFQELLGLGLPLR